MNRLTFFVSSLVTVLCATAQTLPVMRLTVPDEITPTMTYSNGQMVLQEEGKAPVVLKARFKSRGATAKQFIQKPSLSMKLTEEDYNTELDSSLLRLPTISHYVLNAMAIDRICMRDRVIMDLWNQASRLPYETDDYQRLNGTLGHFVEVYINDDYKGIYCLSTRITRSLLHLKKWDKEKKQVRGVLYKCGTLDIEDQNNRGWTADSLAMTVQWHAAFELKHPDDHAGREAWQPLIDLYDTKLNFNYIKKHFFLENLADYQLLVMTFGIEDNWGNKNWYLSCRNIQKDINDPDPAEAERRKFVLTPWDLDTGFGGHYAGKWYNGNYSLWTPRDAVNNGGFLPFAPIQDAPEYKALLKKRWQALRAGSFSVPHVSQALRQNAKLFVQSGAWQRQWERWNGKQEGQQMVSDLNKEVELIIAWYTRRFAQMDEYFGTTPTAILSPQAQKPNSDTRYNLNGRRILQPNQRGIYVQKGKKIIATH